MAANRMEKIFAPLIECVSGKLVYEGAKDVSNKSTERLISQDCSVQVGQRIPHPCTKSERQKNYTAIVKSKSPTTQGNKVLYGSIKDLSINDSGNTIALKTYGPKQLAVSVGKTEVKNLSFL